MLLPFLLLRCTSCSKVVNPNFSSSQERSSKMVPQTPSLMPHKISLFVLGGWGGGGYTFSSIIKITLVPFDIAKLPIMRWEKLTLNINCCTYHDLIVNKHMNSILKLRLVSDISFFFFFFCFMSNTWAVHVSWSLGLTLLLYGLWYLSRTCYTKFTNYKVVENKSKCTMII